MGIPIFEETDTPTRIILLRINNTNNCSMSEELLFFLLLPLSCFNFHPKEDECVNEKKKSTEMLC